MLGAVFAFPAAGAIAGAIFNRLREDTSAHADRSVGFSRHALKFMSAGANTTKYERLGPFRSFCERRLECEFTHRRTDVAPLAWGDCNRED